MARQNVIETGHQTSSRASGSEHSLESRERTRYRPEPQAELTARAVMKAVIDQKGLDARALDLRGISDVADFFVIVSGTSDRHVRSLADKVKQELKLMGETPSSFSGYETAEWVLIDYGDVVVHIFFEPTRQHYEFDELWAHARVLPVDPDLEPAARKLRTGIYR